MNHCEQIADKIKDMKIAKGCKIAYVSNQLWITYPLHKREQYAKELPILKSIYSIDVTGKTTITGTFQGHTNIRTITINIL